MKHRILFVCHGNICRSPMAEFVMKRLVADAGREREFEIASAATSTEEIGNPVYPPARRKLAEHGISCDGKRARQVTVDDYEHYDLLVVMDHNNIRNLMRIIGSDSDGKVHMLLEYAGHDGEEVADPNGIKKVNVPREVADPWYTGNFDATWQDCMEGCTALLERLQV